MIIDKVSRVHAHTHTYAHTHASTRSIYTRTHAVGRGYFAPVGYVERYCCCVVVSVIERSYPHRDNIPLKIAPPQTFIGLSHK